MGQALSGLTEENHHPLNPIQCSIYEESKPCTKKENYNLPTHNRVDYQSSLADITKEFEFLQEKAIVTAKTEYYFSLNGLQPQLIALITFQNFGLNSLVNPIQDTVESLKDLSSSCTSSSVDQQIPKPEGCNCRVWGPDSLTQEGEWICICRNQCQCNEVDWETMLYFPQNFNSDCIDSINLKTNNIKAKLIYHGECEQSGFPCKCIGHSSEVKGKGSVTSDLVTSSEDDPTGRSREEIANVKNSTSQIFTIPSDSEGMQDNKREEKEKKENEVDEVEDEEEVTEVQDINIPKKENSKTGLTCSYGCKLSTEGEIKICQCGCGQMIEIVDDQEKISWELESKGHSCNCIRHIPGDGLKNISKLSLAPYNDTGLMTTIEILQMKCRVKDGLIAVLAEKLRNSSDVDEIADNLSSPHLPKFDIDFDRSLLYEFLTRNILSEPQSEEQLSQHDSVPAPKNFRVVKPILQSLHLAWDLPEKLSNIRAYEILVNGVITSRVRSATRTQAILTSLDFTKPTELTLYSVATNGYISEPLKITFPAHKFI